MSGALHRLTDRQCRTKPVGQYADGGNLYLVVDSADSRYWAFIWKQKQGDKQRRRQIGFGSLKSVSLARARELAAQARADVAAGLDPRRQRDARRGTSPTFGETAEMVLAALGPDWTNATHAQQWRHSLIVRAAALHDVPVDKIDTEMVLSVLQPLWTKRPETAARLRLRLERTLDWARAKGYRSGENPCRWRGHLRDLLPKRKRRPNHFMALPFEQLPDLMQQLRSLEGFAPSALQFTILTACRTSEVLGARWHEIDSKAKSWTIPESRMKSRREFIVPLSDQAIEILRDLPRMDELVFPGRDGVLSHLAMIRVLRQLGIKATVHGTARAGFRTWAMEKTSFQREVVEMCLAHAVGDATEQSYLRGDVLAKRRRVMEAWANFLDRTTAAVVPLRR
jgi:integrase